MGWRITAKCGVWVTVCLRYTWDVNIFSSHTERLSTSPLPSSPTPCLVLGHSSATSLDSHQGFSSLELGWGVVKGVESGEEMEGSLSFDLCLLSKGSHTNQKISKKWEEVMSSSFSYVYVSFSIWLFLFQALQWPSSLWTFLMLWVLSIMDTFLIPDTYLTFVLFHLFLYTHSCFCQKNAKLPLLMTLPIKVLAAWGKGWLLLPFSLAQYLVKSFLHITS